MANQKRFWNYEAEDATFDLSRAFVGITLPGVYRGFDVTLDATLVLKLTHSITGYTETSLLGVASDKRGLIVSKQGVIITEDDAETLPISVGFAQPRIDIIIVEHEFTEVNGGTTAVYSVVQGSPGFGPVPPALPNPEKQVKIGELYIPANITALNDVGVVWTRGKIPVISGLEDNVAIRDEDNTFTESNIFSKAVGLARGSQINVTLTSAPDLTPSIDLSITDDGNYYQLIDSNPYGEVHFVKSNDLGTAISVTFEVKANIIFKHNTVATAQETANGYSKIFNQGGVDINVKIGDFVNLVKYNGIWNVLGVWRKDGALDPTQAAQFPIIGLDNECFAFSNNELGTILQDMITTICNMSTGNAYSFRAEKTVDEDLPINGTAINSLTDPYQFEDDSTSPNHDNGNDMYTDRYVVGADGIPQKFILENIGITMTVGAGTQYSWSIGIYVSTDGGASWNAISGGNNITTFQMDFSVGGSAIIANISSLFTDEVTLNKDDIVAVLIKKENANAAQFNFQLDLGARLSNSF